MQHKRNRLRITATEQISIEIVAMSLDSLVIATVQYCRVGKASYRNTTSSLKKDQLRKKMIKTTLKDMIVKTYSALHELRKENIYSGKSLH